MVIQRVTSGLTKDVLYIGSAVPLETSEGLEAVQMPLRSRYPVENEEMLQGMMGTLEVLPEGIHLKFKDDNKLVILFPYSSLTLCAAVRCIKVTNTATNETVPRFVSLSSPEAGGANSNKPAIFTAIARRSKGRQILECHGFITMSPRDALDLVQWVSMYDRKAKHGNYATVGSSGMGQQQATYEAASAKGDMSFRTDTASTPGFPVQLAPGAPAKANVPQDFINEPPRQGYFYSTTSAQVKKYSLQKFSGGAGAGMGGAGASTMGGASTMMRGGGGGATMGGASAMGMTGPPGEEFPPGALHLPPGGGEQFESRRHGYAASTYSAPAYSAPRPRPPFMVPVRHYRPVPMVMRPMMMPPPPAPHPAMYSMARPRFFSPPPAVERAHPVPYVIAAPHHPPPGFYERPSRRGSGGSSSSDRSSSPDSPRMNGKTSKKNGSHAHHNHHHHHRHDDDSSESSSRPRTPTADYDSSKGGRVSRREQHYMRQGYTTRERHGSPTRSAHGKGFRGGPPRGYVLVPTPYNQYPPGHFPPGHYPPTMVRARSVPPHGERGSLNRKEKKSKKSKKDRKKKKKGSSKREEKEETAAYDGLSDGVTGYTSELGGGPNQPRDFRRTENQFQHERAFSKSLAEEIRKSTKGGQNEVNAYSYLGDQQNEGPLF
ncbi:uncharacterized protein LOC106013792 [Aplysia californica]|uniref:Uncharacterized protein LOC106013792 n=1 Tax=Aplysia californica TaxID=6500 RepID=A0ABM1AE11_APLCA|nr:uncharacterized protein LOC106013792 [Aplysia californica]